MGRICDQFLCKSFSSQRDSLNFSMFVGGKKRTLIHLLIKEKKMKKMFAFMLLVGLGPNLYFKDVAAQNLTSVRKRFAVTMSLCGNFHDYNGGNACLLKLKSLDETKDQAEVLLYIDREEFEENYEIFGLKDTDSDSSNENKNNGRIFEVDFNAKIDELSKEVIAELSDSIQKFCAAHSCLEFDITGLTLLAPENDSIGKMSEVLKGMQPDMFFNIKKLPKGLSIHKKTTLNQQKVLEKVLAKHLNSKLEAWKDYVEQSEEFEHLSKKEKKKIIKNPLKNYFNKDEEIISSLLEVVEVLEIYRNTNELVGYFIKVHDHLQSAMYQDGAWLEMYLDVNQNILFMDEYSS
jgi:hypothetical protein